MPFDIDGLVIGTATVVIVLPLGLSIFDKWDEWEQTTIGQILPIIYFLLILMAFAAKCN